MTKHLLLLIILALATTLCAADSPAPAEPTVVIGESSTIRVTQPGPFSIALDASGLPSEALKKGITPQIKDLGIGQNPETKVAFTAPKQVFTGDTRAIWLFTVTVTGLAPNSTQARKAVITLDKDYARDYTLTNLSAGTINWSVPPVPAPWNVNWSDPAKNRVLGIVVTTQELPATNLRIASASLKDAAGTASFGSERLQLAETPDGDDHGGKFLLKARDTHTFYLRLRDDQPRLHGKFTGSISFAIDERPDLQTLQVTLNSTSGGSKLLGLLLLAIGLLLSWWMTARARPTVARLQAEKPVISVRQALARFRKDLSAVPPVPSISYLKITDRLAKLETSISTEQLDADSLLPPRTLLSFGTATDSSTKLQARLTEVSTALLAMSSVLKNGILKIASEWAKAPDWKKTNAATALPKLDDLGASAKTEAEAQTGISPILAAYEHDPSIQQLVPKLRQPAPVDPVTVQAIDYQIEHYSNAGWWIWGVVSVVVGCAVMIVPNSGFGTSMDFILCFLWGLGIPTASAKLQELTPSGVSSNIGITFPKTGQ